MWLLFAFVAVPLIEIALFIQVGGVIGLWPTLAIVILTAVIGTQLLRRQGLAALGNLRQSFNNMQDPTEHLAHGAMILFAGALLLTPGFFTDTVGFLLLIPAFRTAVFRHVKARVHVQSFTTGQQPRQQYGDSTVIDGEFSEVDPPKKPTHDAPSVTKH